MSNTATRERPQFGTSGLRGLVSDLVGRTSRLYTRAFIAHLREDGSVPPFDRLLIGRDLRSSSPAIARDCATAAAALGVKAIDAGAVSTPALAVYALERRLPAIMITGSHIPEDRNGLKFYTAKGEITKRDEAAIARFAAAFSASPAADGDGEAGASPFAGSAEATVWRCYEERCLGLLMPGALKGLSIGVFEHSTVVRDRLKAILEKLGADVTGLGRASAFVAMDTESARPEDAERIRGWTAEHRLDALVSADGDADRPLVAGHDGRVIRGDTLGFLTAKFLAADAIVTPVTSNSALEGSGAFAAVKRTRVGSPYVIEGMAEMAAAGRSAIIGFEANGGVLVGSDIAAADGTLAALPTRDALPPILAALGLALRLGMRVADLASLLPARFTASDRLRNIPAEASRRLLERLEADSALRARFFPSDSPDGAPDLTDGVRMRGASADIVHLRASGNAPELRCYSEAASAERAETLLRNGLEVAQQELTAG